MRYHLIALGIVIAAATPLSAQPVYRLHDNGSIWVNTAPCSGASCPWVLLDNNPITREITASGVRTGGFQSHKAPPDAPALYQRRADGTIWLYNGKPCDGASCPGWQMLDKNQQTVSIVAAGLPNPENLILYKRHNNGEIWRYTQTPCKGASCPGWERLDKNPKTQEIIAAGTHLYQRHNDGAIWHYKGTPCKGDLCPGWERLDDNPKTVEITAAAVGNNDVPMLYKRHNDGEIWRYTGPSCRGAAVRVRAGSPSTITRAPVGSPPAPAICTSSTITARSGATAVRRGAAARRAGSSSTTRRRGQLSAHETEGTFHLRRRNAIDAAPVIRFHQIREGKVSPTHVSGLQSPSGTGARSISISTLVGPTLRINRRAAPLLLMTAGVSAVGCMRLLGGALHTHNLWSYLFITPVFSVIGQGLDISEIN